ncbi:hypothetical protein CW304_28065 [Bacillus sp. UFRGS-B20]|nr:hypothetical protein CW304_28065 [Bacillus sp. UFRGS-B20]
MYVTNMIQRTGELLIWFAISWLMDLPDQDISTYLQFIRVCWLTHKAASAIENKTCWLLYLER